MVLCMFACQSNREKRWSGGEEMGRGKSLLLSGHHTADLLGCCQLSTEIYCCCNSYGTGFVALLLLLNSLTQIVGLVVVRVLALVLIAL